MDLRWQHTRLEPAGGARIAALSFVLAALTAPACSAVSFEVETLAAPDAQLSSVDRVVLVPLVNRSDDPRASTALQATLARSLAASAGMQVLEVPAGFAVDPEKLDREQARDLAKATGADAVLTGVVFAYGYVPVPRSPRQPAIRLDVRLLSGADPALLWAARASVFDAAGAMDAGTSLTTMADEVAKRLVEDLMRHR